MAEGCIFTMTLKKGIVMTNTTEIRNWTEIFDSNKPSIIDRVDVIAIKDGFVFVKYSIGDLHDVKAVFDAEDSIEKIMDEFSSIAMSALAQYIKRDEYVNHRNR